MERMMSVEEKIRRAEEIYLRRRGENQRPTAKVNLNNDENKKDIKLLKKLIIQILICVVIYIIIYVINNSQLIFSQDFINKVNEILSYDTNFIEIYENCKNYLIGIIPAINQNQENTNSQEETEKIEDAQNETTQNENSQNTENQQTNNIERDQEPQDSNVQAIGGASENVSTNNNQENSTNLSQEEQDIQNVKNTTTFIKPIEGTITSAFGIRDPETQGIPTNHTGTDIAANLGTKIKSASDGEVVLASEEGDYGKHLKIQIGEVSIIYAHCNALYVKQGDKVVQGQEIAEVGSTGNSTGPHLHFEIRYQERKIDPQKILDL